MRIKSTARRHFSAQFNPQYGVYTFDLCRKVAEGADDHDGTSAVETELSKRVFCHGDVTPSSISDRQSSRHCCEVLKPCWLSGYYVSLTCVVAAVNLSCGGFCSKGTCSQVL